MEIVRKIPTQARHDVWDAPISGEDSLEVFEYCREDSYNFLSLVRYFVKLPKRNHDFKLDFKDEKFLFSSEIYTAVYQLYFGDRRKTVAGHHTDTFGIVIYPGQGAWRTRLDLWYGGRLFDTEKVALSLPKTLDRKYIKEYWAEAQKERERWQNWLDEHGQYEEDSQNNFMNLAVGTWVFTEYLALVITGPVFCYYPDAEDSQLWWAYPARKDNGIDTHVFVNTIKQIGGTDES